MGLLIRLVRTFERHSGMIRSLKSGLLFILLLLVCLDVATTGLCLKNGMRETDSCISFSVDNYGTVTGLVVAFLPVLAAHGILYWLNKVMERDLHHLGRTGEVAALATNVLFCSFFLRSIEVRAYAVLSNVAHFLQQNGTGAHFIFELLSAYRRTP